MMRTFASWAGLLVLAGCSSSSSSSSPSPSASTSAAASAVPSSAAPSGGLTAEEEERNRLILEELAGAKKRAMKDGERRDQLKGLMKKLPKKNSPSREELLVGAVRQGLHDDITWATVQTQFNGHEAVIEVMADALKLNGVRIDVTAIGSQRIADILGLWMPTPRILQAIWEQADVRITACNSKPDASMADTFRMFQHSECVDERIGDRKGLMANVGKHWVLSNRLAGHKFLAANYGWFRTTTRPWQNVGTAHDVLHTDYSQVLRLVKPRVLVDGDHVDIREVARSPELWGLVSDEGPLKVLRIPTPVHEKRVEDEDDPNPLVTAPALDAAVELKLEGLPLDPKRLPAEVEYINRETLAGDLEDATRLTHDEIPDEAFVSKASSYCGGRDLFSELLGETHVTVDQLERHRDWNANALSCGRKMLDWAKKARSHSFIFMADDGPTETDILPLPKTAKQAHGEHVRFAALRGKAPGTDGAFCMDAYLEPLDRCPEGGRSPVQVGVPGGFIDVYAENWPQMVKELNDPAPLPKAAESLFEVYAELDEYEEILVAAGKRCSLIFDHSLAPRSLVETNEQTFTVWMADHATLCARGHRGSLLDGEWHDIYVAPDEATAVKMERKLKARAAALGAESHPEKPTTPAEGQYFDTLERIRDRFAKVVRFERKGTRIDITLPLEATEAERKGAAPYLAERRAQVKAAAEVIRTLEKGELPSAGLLERARGPGRAPLDRVAPSK